MLENLNSVHNVHCCRLIILANIKQKMVNAKVLYEIQTDCPIMRVTVENASGLSYIGERC